VEEGILSILYSHRDVFVTDNVLESTGNAPIDLFLTRYSRVQLLAEAFTAVSVTNTSCINLDISFKLRKFTFIINMTFPTLTFQCLLKTFHLRVNSCYCFANYALGMR
jgi:hypothetical protein